MGLKGGRNERGGGGGVGKNRKRKGGRIELMLASIMDFVAIFACSPPKIIDLPELTHFLKIFCEPPYIQWCHL